MIAKYGGLKGYEFRLKRGAVKVNDPVTIEMLGFSNQKITTKIDMTYSLNKLWSMNLARFDSGEAHALANKHVYIPEDKAGNVSNNLGETYKARGVG
jgi:hypothetical protein